MQNCVFIVDISRNTVGAIIIVFEGYFLKDCQGYDGGFLGIWNDFFGKALVVDLLKRKCRKESPALQSWIF